MILDYSLQFQLLLLNVKVSLIVLGVMRWKIKNDWKESAFQGWDRNQLTIARRANSACHVFVSKFYWIVYVLNVAAFTKKEELSSSNTDLMVSKPSICTLWASHKKVVDCWSTWLSLCLKKAGSLDLALPVIGRGKCSALLVSIRRASHGKLLSCTLCIFMPRGSSKSYNSCSVL